MNTPHLPLAFFLGLFAVPVAVQAGDVWITPQIESIEVVHHGEPVLISRNQDRNNVVNPIYAHTSRKCPPFCIQPMVVAPGVETIGELEMLDFLARVSQGDQSVLVIDTRTPQWPRRGMIPGAINIPWTLLDTKKAAPESVGTILIGHFGASSRGGTWDFSNAKTLVLYCNGMWCSQSNRAVKLLLHYGYPAQKLKWYRGGMQNWENLGLTTVRLEE